MQILLDALLLSTLTIKHTCQPTLEKFKKIYSLVVNLECRACTTYHFKGAKCLIFQVEGLRGTVSSPLPQGGIRQIFGCLNSQSKFQSKIMKFCYKVRLAVTLVGHGCLLRIMDTAIPGQIRKFPTILVYTLRLHAIKPGTFQTRFDVRQGKLFNFFGSASKVVRREQIIWYSECESE